VCIVGRLCTIRIRGPDNDTPVGIKGSCGRVGRLRFESGFPLALRANHALCKLPLALRDHHVCVVGRLRFESALPDNPVGLRVVYCVNVGV
jgi:hypothetical protein